MDFLSRRTFLRTGATALLTHFLLEQCFLHRAFGAGLAPLMQAWLLRLHEACYDLKAETLSLVGWQKEMAALHASVSLEEIIQCIEMGKLLKGIQYAHDLGVVLPAPLPSIKDLPPVTFGSKLFAYKARAATPPHAHNNVVSAHLVLRGTIRTRTFDRLADEKGYLLLTPTRDRQETPGSVITMSDDKDNVHWFVGSSPTSCSFDIAMNDVLPNQTYTTPSTRYGTVYLDPTLEKPVNGILAAKLIGFEEAVAKFGGTGI